MIPIFKPYMPKNITHGMDKILYSGNLAYGEIGKKFEKELSNYIGNEKLLTISSYNQALLIILSTLDLSPGDEVIASPVSCLASNQPFAIKGLKVIWADIDPQFGTLCAKDVESKITSKTKAIFHNHFCGYLGDIENINNLGKKYGIPVIDDCIEAFGSQFKGQKTGNLGTDITIFSFQTIRLPNTIQGAALVFNNLDNYIKAKMIRDYGINRKNFRDKNNEINPNCDVKLEGYGALMSEINSFIGLRQLQDLDSLIKIQQTNAKLWNEIFKNSDEFKSLKIIKNSKPNNWVYGVLAKNKSKAINHFRKKGYYATGVHINNNIYSIFKNKIELISVNEFMNHFIAIPSGWWYNLKYDKE